MTAGVHDYRNGMGHAMAALIVVIVIVALINSIVFDRALKQEFILDSIGSFQTLSDQFRETFVPVVPTSSKRPGRRLCFFISQRSRCLHA